MNEQISKARRGSITASEAHAIMTGWDEPEPPIDDSMIDVYQWIAYHDKKPLVRDIKPVMSCEVNSKIIDACWKRYRFLQPNQGLVTYAETLASEELFEDDPALSEINSPHIVNGNEREGEAVRRLAEATGLDFAHAGEEQVHINVNGIGCTADGLVKDEIDLIATGCEAKCRSNLYHLRQSFIRDNATLLQLDPKRYCQIQVCMYVTGAEEWYSCSFNPLAKYSELEFNYCKIERDEKYLAVFERRAKQTFDVKQRFIEKIRDAHPGMLQEAA